MKSGVQFKGSCIRIVINDGFVFKGSKREGSMIYGPE